MVGTMPLASFSTIRLLSLNPYVNLLDPGSSREEEGNAESASDSPPTSRHPRSAFSASKATSHAAQHALPGGTSFEVPPR